MADCHSRCAHRLRTDRSFTRGAVQVRDGGVRAPRPTHFKRCRNTGRRGRRPLRMRCKKCEGRPYAQYIFTLLKKPRRVRVRRREKFKSFFTATCAWGKIPLRLQVWNFEPTAQNYARSRLQAFWQKKRSFFARFVLCVVLFGGAAEEKGAEGFTVKGQQGVKIAAARYGLGGGHQHQHAHQTQDKSPPA